MADPSFALRYMEATRNAVSNLDRAEAAEAEIGRLRAEIREARNAASEALGCRFITDMCDCGNTTAYGVCHMVERLRLLRDGN